MRKDYDDFPDNEFLFGEYDKDRYGHLRRRPDTTGMHFPVRCTHCDEVYDVGTVTVTARYSDCSMWESPCCHRQVDDRGPFWKSRPDVEKLY